MNLDDFPLMRLQLGDTSYPKCLLSLLNPPKVLYYRGPLHDRLFTYCLGVVGSRSVSSYGNAVLRHIFYSLCSDDLSTVSGFSRGVDYVAHSLSIERNIPTIAVLPHGVDYGLSGAHSSLYNQILCSGGVILSEYANKEPPKDWMYVKRNRLVAGLCTLLLVVEARESSGSLITYEYAKKYKKRVATIPADIFRENSWGVCHLLKQGASVVTSGQDINNLLGITKKSILDTFHTISTPDELLVLKHLQKSPSGVSTLATETGIPISKLSSFVIKLQLNGLVQEIKGLLYAIKA